MSQPLFDLILYRGDLIVLQLDRTAETADSLPETIAAAWKMRTVWLQHPDVIKRKTGRGSPHKGPVMRPSFVQLYRATEAANTSGNDHRCLEQSRSELRKQKINK